MGSPPARAGDSTIPHIWPSTVGRSGPGRLSAKRVQEAVFHPMLLADGIAGFRRIRRIGLRYTTVKNGPKASFSRSATGNLERALKQGKKHFHPRPGQK